MQMALTESSLSIRKGWWLICLLPPIAFVALEETPGLSSLDGINAAALIVLSPFVLAAGFGLTAAIILLARWVARKAKIRSGVGFAVLVLVIVGLLSPMEYLDHDWLLLSVIELASLPAALILGPSLPTQSHRG
jgi:hypothetical protein